MHLHSLFRATMFLLSGTAIYAAPMITLNTKIPSQLTQIPHSICASNKGGYLVCGTAIDSNGHKNGFLLRTNSSGVQNGRVSISSAGQEIEMLSTCQTFDGGYAVSGYVNPGYYGGEDWGVIKYDSLGKRLWTRQYGYSGNDRPLCMIQTADSGFLMAGYTVGTSLDTTVAIKKLDKNGLSQWDVIRRTTWSIFTSAKQTHDKGYILTGGVRSAVNGKEALLFKVDSLGNVQWYKPYGGKKDEIGNSVETTSDGGYIVSGSTTSYGKGKEDALVFKVDSMGNLQWYKTFGGVESDEACGITQIGDYYYWVGNMRSFSADSMAMMYQMDSKGDSVWSTGFRRYIGNGGINLKKTVNNSFAICYLHVDNGVTAIGIAAFEGATAKIAAGNHHSLILKSNGALWACGDNSDGQFGNGQFTLYETEVYPPLHIMDGVQNIATGLNHSLILKSDGTLWTCGRNWYGQLGNGTSNKPSNLYDFGYQPNPDPTLYHVMNGVQSIEAGGDHSLILKTDGTLWACGFNYWGQLGDGTTSNDNSPVQVMTNVKSMAAGYSHTLILKTDGTLWTCGGNYDGQLGNGFIDEDKHPNPIKIMNGVQSIAAGGWHSLILKTDGTLWACGDNESGQLGDGTKTDRNTPVLVMEDVQSISAGEEHSLILKTDGTFWACGNNDAGQLGDGTYSNHSTPKQFCYSHFETSDPVAGPPLKDVDGNIYTTVKIGNQLWTVENLRTTHLNDGTPIPLVTGDTAWYNLSTPGYCFYNNSTYADTNKKYGALYNWYAVNTGKLAPAGWHVPTNADWSTLENYLIANGYNYNGTTTGNQIAKSMAATSGWYTYGYEGAPGSDQSLNNRSGFSAFPGGYRVSGDNKKGIFKFKGFYGGWWSSSTYSSEGMSCNLYWELSFSEMNYFIKKNSGFSVRLVRD